MTRILSLLALIVLAVPAFTKPITVSGRLLGHDGSPMPAAAIMLTDYAMFVASLTDSSNTQPRYVTVGSDGRFAITVPGPGVYVLGANGVNHKAGGMPLLLAGDTNVALDMRLGTYAFSTSFDSVRVIGEFNDYSFDSAAVLMKRLSNGTYVAEIPWKGKHLSYQLLGVAPGRSVNGTSSIGWEYDGDRDYRSSVRVQKGKARIVFDPRKLPPSDTKFVLTAADPSSALATYLRVNAEIERRRNAARATKAKWQPGMDMKELRDQNDAELTAIAEQLDTVTNTFARQLLLLSYIIAPSPSGRDSTIAQMAAREIEPESLLWSMFGSEISTMYFYAGKLPTPLTRDEYLERASTSHPEAGVRSQTTLERLRYAHYANDSLTEAAMYARLIEKHPNSIEAKAARAEYDPNRAIQVGRRIPEFSFASLNDPKITYTDTSMLGRFYLIDFWATWCGPCIGEMGSLHAAYDRFRGKNFEILSLSFDRAPREVTAFVEKKWKMPWLHSFVEGGFGNPNSVRFGVVGIPKPILVGPDGTIIAIEADLRGQLLESTLEQVLQRSDPTGDR